MRLKRRALAAATAVLACTVSLMVSAPAQAAPPKGATLVSPNSIADPGFAKFGNTYYIYGTGPKAQNVPIYAGASPDKRFKSAGYAFKGDNLNGFRLIWAPHVMYHGGKYFMFFTAINGKAPQHCIYWAVSSSNKKGSYSKPKNLFCANGAGYEAIDPSTYHAADGKDYLVWRKGKATAFPHGDWDIRYQQLSFAGSTVSFTFQSTSRSLAQPKNGTPKNDVVIEAPSVIRHDGWVYLFVSRGSYSNSSYHTEVWVAKTINSPFSWQKTLMKSGQGYGSGPGGAEALTVGGKAYIAWHYRDAGVRRTVISDIRWTTQRGDRPEVPTVA